MDNLALIEDLKKELPVTESQARMEIDLITKPKEMQKQQHQGKILGIDNESGQATGKGKGIAKRSQAIGKLHSIGSALAMQAGDSDAESQVSPLFCFSLRL